MSEIKLEPSRVELQLDDFSNTCFSSKVRMCIALLPGVRFPFPPRHLANLGLTIITVEFFSTRRFARPHDSNFASFCVGPASFSYYIFNLQNFKSHRENWGLSKSRGKTRKSQRGTAVFYIHTPSAGLLRRSHGQNPPKLS